VNPGRDSRVKRKITAQHLLRYATTDENADEGDELLPMIALRKIFFPDLLITTFEK
jgi:hypothetical protein